MKRKLLLIGVALVMLLSSVGCIRFEETIKFNADGTADIRALVAYSDSAASMLGGAAIEPSEEQIAEYEAKGYTYESYQEDGFTGYVLTRNGISLEELEEELANSEDESEMGSALVGNFLQVDGKHITIHFTPYSDEDYEETGMYLSMINSYNGYIRFTIELPVKPSEHNATSVSNNGKTLTWDLTTMKANEAAHAEFDLPSGSVWTWLLPVLCAVGAAIIAVVLVLMFRKKPAAETNDGEPIEPQTEEPIASAASEYEESEPTNGEFGESEAANGEFGEGAATGDESGEGGSGGGE